MRLTLIAAAGAAAIAGPASAQNHRVAEEIDRVVPAIDRTTQALLDLDLGPILDAADPGRPHRARTLRDMALRDDPDFERRMRASIHGSAASLHRMSAAAAAAEPALRHALAQFQASIAAAMDAPMAALPPPPPGDAEDLWYPEDEAPPPPEPYDE